MIGTLDGNAITTSDVLGKYESYIDKTNRLDTFYNMGGVYTSPPQNEFNIVVTKKI